MSDPYFGLEWHIKHLDTAVDGLDAYLNRLYEIPHPTFSVEELLGLRELIRDVTSHVRLMSEDVDAAIAGRRLPKWKRIYNVLRDK